jgi:hypothetical protein
MNVASGSRQLSPWSRYVSAQASAGHTTAPGDFGSLVQRLVAYKPQYQFKVLSARLKAHQVRVLRQAAGGAGPNLPETSRVPAAA